MLVTEVLFSDKFECEITIGNLPLVLTDSVASSIFSEPLRNAVTGCGSSRRSLLAEKWKLLSVGENERGIV